MGRYTTKELADMKLPGFPGTPQGWDLRVKSEGWEFVEAHGRGRGGMRREYVPPANVQALIDKRLAGAHSSAEVVESAKSVVSEEGAPANKTPVQAKDFLTNGKDLMLMAQASSAVRMFVNEEDPGLTVEDEGRLVGILYDQFLDRPDVNARKMADFLKAAWRGSRPSAA